MDDHGGSLMLDLPNPTEQIGPLKGVIGASHAQKIGLLCINFFFVHRLTGPHPALTKP